MQSLQRAGGQPLRLGLRLGAGGEAAVYALEDDPSLAAKLYHRPSESRRAKLEAMIACPPAAVRRGHAGFAWPRELLVDARGGLAGFLMPRVDAPSVVPLFQLYHPHDRLSVAPAFTWSALLRTAHNLAATVELLHTRGYVAGDLNESNLLVSRSALVTLIDCDSLQVPAPGGRAYRCPVGKAEYTPPELQGRDFGTIDRTANADSFGLTVLIALLLMEGVHPFAGVPAGTGAMRTIEEHIRRGDCPYTRPERLLPPPFAPPLTMLPPGVQALLLRCFGAGLREPALRPSATEWRIALADAEQDLTRCAGNRRHAYAGHLRACPWCERVRAGLPDSFPPATRRLSPRHAASATRETRPPKRTAPRAPARAGGGKVARTSVRPTRVASVTCGGLAAFNAAAGWALLPNHAGGAAVAAGVTLVAALAALALSLRRRGALILLTLFALAAAGSLAELALIVLNTTTSVKGPLWQVLIAIGATLCGGKLAWDGLSAGQHTWVRRGAAASATGVLLRLALRLVLNR